ncbi:MAG TPA: TlpA disulfide reductase family protein [Hanamia sp.]
MKPTLRIFLGFSFLIMMSCNRHVTGKSELKPENTYNIEGKINGMDSGWLYLGMYDTTFKAPLVFFDSAKIIDSNFQFKGKFTNPAPCKIMVKNLKFLWPATHYFILDTGLTKVQLFKDSMDNSVITGPKSQEQFMAFNKKLYDLEISFDKNFSLQRKGIISADSLNTLEEAFYHKKSDLLLQQVKANPASIISAFIVKNNLNYIIDIPTLEEIYNSLNNKDNYYAQSILNYSKVLVARTKTGIGFQAPYFNITDSKNREITNETFKGKYLLIDFWASWCKGCREENPYLVKAYKKFSAKGFEMVSISVDMNKQDWEDAIKKDNLSWIQACDLKSSDHNVISRDFGIVIIPTNFLIDKEGKIVAKDLMDENIEKELQKYLGK